MSYWLKYKLKQWLLALGMIVVGTDPVMAQPKPIGAYSLNPHAPSWMSIGMICGDCWNDLELHNAVLMSRQSGKLWVVQLGFFDPPAQPATETARRVKDRLIGAGLWPYVIATVYGEEWYERWLQGEFSYLGLRADDPNGSPIIEDWLGKQNKLVKDVMGKPTVWVTHMVTSWRRVPQNIDVVMLDPYLTDEQPFDIIENIFLDAERQTWHPLVVVPRWFRSMGNWPQGTRPPSKDVIDGYARILGRQRYIAMVGFLWESRPWADLIGLEQMPETRKLVERSLGIR